MAVDSSRKFDLILTGGTVIDPLNGLNAKADVAISAGKIAAVSTEFADATTTASIDVTGCLVMPGLIDLHTHTYVDGSPLGVDPDKLMRSSGTTTIVDAGSAGAANFAGFHRFVISAARPRMFAYLNVSYPGIFGFGKGIMVGECLDARLLDAESCVRVARKYQDVIVGIKVRIGIGTSGDLGTHPLDIALEVADRLDLPVMAHIGAPPPGIDDVLDRLRRGDVLTHCFRPTPNSATDGKGLPRDAILRARERGVLFDIGHGSGSFGFETYEAMVTHGFYPDTISSDVHVMSARGPAFDLLHTMSKFWALGMALDDVIRAATAAPAAAIRRPGIGCLSPGSPADAVVLKADSGSFEYEDCTGQTLESDRKLALRHIVLGGNVVEPGSAGHQGSSDPS